MSSTQSTGMEGFGASFGGPSSAASEAQVSFWNVNALKSAPEIQVLSELSEKTSTGDIVVREITYDSPGTADERLKIFAYYAFPASKANMKLPAIVWVHGGASLAHREAAIEWASRGYAAISMDLPGKGGPHREKSRSEGPDMTDENIFKVTPSPKNSYLYLSVNAVCRAISVMQAQKEVDASRIGVLGFSWGGVITLLVNGIDSRVTAACTVFGAGFIPDESCWITGQLSALSASEIKTWRQHFDPSSYLESQHGRTLFVSATGDTYYPIRSFTRTFGDARCEKALCFTLNKNHEIDNTTSANITRWFDYALRSGSAFPEIKSKVEGDTLEVTASGKQPVVKVVLVTADSTDLSKAKWTETQMKNDKGVWTATAPEENTPYFIQVTDDAGATAAGDVHLPAK